jgi:hypothetical protein
VPNTPASAAVPSYGEDATRSLLLIPQYLIYHFSEGGKTGRGGDQVNDLDSSFISLMPFQQMRTAVEVRILGRLSGYRWIIDLIKTVGLLLEDLFEDLPPWNFGQTSLSPKDF